MNYSQHTTLNHKLLVVGTVIGVYGTTPNGGERMSQHNTTMTWMCRACGNTYVNRDQAISHVNDKNDGEHSAEKPYKMVMLDINTDDEMCIESKIKEAFQRIQNGEVKGYGPDIGQEEIKYVSEAANVPKKHCIRVLEDEGIDYTYPGTVTCRIEDISGKIGKAVRYMIEHDTDDMTRKAIAEESGINYHSVANAEQRYGWLIDYHKRNSDKDEDYHGEVETMGVEQALEEMSGDDEQQDDQSTVKQETKEVTTDGQEDNEYVLDKNETFNYIKLLIKNGNIDEAHDVYDKMVSGK